MLRNLIVALACGALLAGCATVPATPGATPDLADARAREALLDYLRSRNTTGFLAIQHGVVLAEHNFPAPDADPVFAPFAYERTADGALLEDIASLQKSVVAVLVAIAADKGLIDTGAPVSAYLGSGWSAAAPEQEAAIRVDHVLTMTSGLDEGFRYQAPPGTRFFYNTPVYAITKSILAAASGRSIEDLTRDWLTAPLDMRDTAWRPRPAALGNVGNASGLVTSPRDLARLGAMILAEGRASDGTQVVSSTALNSLFAASAANPSYGRLWWLNRGPYAIGAAGVRRPGALIPNAPADLVAALGYLDRRLYVAPSLGLVVVRTGAGAAATDFDARLWELLRPLLRP